MTDQEHGGEDGAEVATRPDDPEEVVDELEERVLGHTVDQSRDEDPEEPAFEQDLDTDDPAQAPDAEPETGPGAEPPS